MTLRTRFFTLLILVLGWIPGMGIESVMAQQMLVGSYNIRYKNGGDSIQGDLWTKRCQVICDQVNFMSPDIFGAQEVLHGQLNDMLRCLDGYDYIGVGRDDGKTAGEYAAIFYRTDRVTLLEQGHFWLSETPDVPGLGWDAACVRVCSWGKFARFEERGARFEERGARFEERGRRFEEGGRRFEERLPSREFYFFNLHMDHVGVTARREAAKLVVKKIGEIAEPGALVVLTGDFNVDQNDEIYRIFTDSGLLKDSYEAARLRFAENGTFNSFKSDLFTESRIDHIFVTPTADVDAYGVLTDCYWQPEEVSEKPLKSADAPQEISFQRYRRRLPSDHYPVFVRLK